MITNSSSSPRRRRAVVATATLVAALAAAVVVVVVADGGGTTRQAGRTTPPAPAAPASGTTTPVPSLKRPLAGLLTRDGPPAPALAPAVSGWVVNADWRDLQPTPDGPLARDNVIDRDIAEARRTAAPGATAELKVRLFAGTQAPDWAKSLGGAPVPVTDPQSGRTGTIPEAIRALISEANNSQSPWRVQNNGQMPKRSRASTNCRRRWSQRAKENWPWSRANISSP